MKGVSELHGGRSPGEGSASSWFCGTEISRVALTLGRLCHEPHPDGQWPPRAVGGHSFKFGSNFP